MPIEMEDRSAQKWNFRGNESMGKAAELTIRGVLAKVIGNVDKADERKVIPLGHGDPSHFPCFRTALIAEDAVQEALRSAKFNFYCPSVGFPPARKAVAEYLSRDLPYKLSYDDVYLTLGCQKAIEVTLTVLARAGANILLPQPGFPRYEARCGFEKIEVRHFDLMPERGWEIDLGAVEALADENTVAMVIINPGNPCGNVFTYEHLHKVAETAKKLGILVISDEVYDHLAFGSNPFVPMGVFGSIVPVLTLGSISKRWLVPGWRMGWLVTSDPNGILQKSGIVDCIKGCLNMTSDPPTFIQAALPQILERTTDDFFMKVKNILKEAADICFDGLREIPCITCPHKPEGSMFAMVKLNISELEDIADDVDFAHKLAREESVIILPGDSSDAHCYKDPVYIKSLILPSLTGISLGLKNWLRITFAIEPSSLEGLKRIKAFHHRHDKRM